MGELDNYPGYYRRCDRCWKRRVVSELIEDPVTPGIFVCPECADEPGLLENKRDSAREAVRHYFKNEA